MSANDVSTAEKKSKHLWIKIGEIERLMIYPLSSGHAVPLEQITITHNGITMDAHLWDSMFVIYNRHTKCIYDSSNAVLLYIKVAFEPPDRYEFSLFNLKFKLSLREVCKRADTVRCVQTVSGKYIVKKKCNDCGEDAVNWLRACLKDTDARLAYVDPADKGNLQSCLHWLYHTTKHDDLEKRYLPMPPSCKVMSQDSYDQVKKIAGFNVRKCDLTPNIIFTTNVPYKEDEMEWLKIGDAIVKTLRPCLKSKSDPICHLPLELRAQLLSIPCETFGVGQVKVGQKVYTLNIEDN